MRLGTRTYLLAILGTLCVAPVILLGTITARRASQSERARADHDSWARATAVARELDQFMAAQIGSVELLAGHVEAAGGLASPVLQDVITRHRQRSPQLAFAYLANRSGISLYADPPFSADGASNAGVNYSDRDYFREVVDGGRTAISRVQLGRRSRVPNIQVAAPIRNPAGELVGFAEGSVDLEAMSEILASAVVGERDSRMIVTDAAGRVLADSSGRLQVLGDVSALPLFAAGVATQQRSTTDERGAEIRVAAARTTQVPWTITAIRDQSSVEALAVAARRDAVVITLVALLIALAVVGFGVHWLSRPARALQAVNDRLRTMVVGIEHAGNAIEVADAQGRLIYVNPAWEQFTGYTAAEVIGKSFVELLAIEGSFVIDVWTRLVKGEPWRGVCATHRKNGKLVEIELDAVPVMRDDGTIGHVVATRVDLTEKRRAEEVLRMNDRLAAVGTLAAGVAHEINNPLTYVTANLSFVRQALESPDGTVPPAERDDVMQAFREALLGIERVTVIVRDLKQLSRTDEKSSTEIDVNHLLESSIRMANLEIRHRASVETSYGNVGPITGNEARLAQVFLNLLINAAQACDVAAKATNVIRVTTRPSDDGGHAIVEIADTGRGIEPEIVEHIFDAFFTTKPLGVGTGLGLSICHGIVQQLGGTITVDSAPGAGSTFRVTLPVAARPAARAPTANAASPALRLRVLVVDDEATLATALRRMLRDHDVTTAASAVEALAIVEQQQFDVLLSDIMMPGLNGFELYERICAAHPEYAKLLVFMTGGIIHPGLVEKIEELGTPCLYKPFTRDALLEMIAAVVRQHHESLTKPRLAVVAR